VFPLKDNIPTDRTPYVTLALIALNVVAYFLLQEGRLGLPVSGAEWPVEDYAARACDLTNRCAADPGDVSPLASVFTSMFMHGSIVHLGGNMLFLWIFGNNVEDSMGSAKFLVFYLLGGYILLFPKARVVTLIFIVFFVTIVQLPALVVLGFWFVQQVLFGYFDLVDPGQEGGGVAYFAHIGGFVFGLALIKVFASRRRERERPLF
jgi:membrane associated rhomboid family serine protease